MAHRPVANRRDSSQTIVVEDNPMVAETENLSDDDNAQPDIDVEDAELENEDPLLLAIDDLEGRVVVALDDLKLHPGVRTDLSPRAPNVHEELATLLRPVTEVAAHTAPSVARTYHRGVGAEGVEASMDDVYERIISDLVLPVILQIAQSDTIPAKRGASLEFFRTLWKEYHKSGSWLDNTISGPQQGPYGAGGSHHQQAPAVITPAMRSVQKRRQQKRLTREGEILRYWIEASIACLTPGVFTSDESEDAVLSRAIISASASIRPSLSHISQRIKDADDRGAARMYAPVMKMVEAVLKKLFLGCGDSVRSASIKFIEIVILCCSRRPKDAGTRRRGQSTMEGFSLDDLPTGHPVITQENLESVSEYAFTTLRGLALMGGQVKIDVNILSEMVHSSGQGSSPSEQVVSILKPAALAFLEFESMTLKQDEDGNVLNFEIDRSNVEFDFLLSQKPYAITINAISALAINRPDFFTDSATVVARRASNPPVVIEGVLDKAGVLAITAHLKATCLTLLRNALSVTTNSSTILHQALKKFGMDLQAEKALEMANQAISLQSAGRAARNRANMFYQWDASESDRRSTKRQRETDDALAKMRAAKAARGLGNGIQLPTFMSDAVDLIMLNLVHLPKKHPSAAQKPQATKSRKAPISLDYVVDAVMTNGASLMQEDGRWYDRDGGTAWNIDTKSTRCYQLAPRLLEAIGHKNEHTQVKLEDKDAEEIEQRKNLFMEQCKSAASDAVGRILSVSSSSKSDCVRDVCNRLLARLTFTLGNVKPSSGFQASFASAKSSAKMASQWTGNEKVVDFVDEYPLAAVSLALDASISPESDTADVDSSLFSRLLNEALAESGDRGDLEKYDNSLEAYVASVVQASQLAADKVIDSDRKKIAANAAANLQKDILSLPRLTRRSLIILCRMCDVDDITKKASDASKKSSLDSIAASAAAHAAKVAAEKRATAVLFILRDIAFQRDNYDARKAAVHCAVSIASGQLPSSPSIQENALKLTMNVLFTRNEALANMVVDAATEDLEVAAEYAIERYDSIQRANKEADNKTENTSKNPLAPRSDEEKKAIDQMRKHAVLSMALCVRRTDLIHKLFSISCRDKCDVLSKAVRANMQKLSRAAAQLHGASKVAIQVAEMTERNQLPMLLSFLENLVPMDRSLPEQDLIDAFFKIQEAKIGDDGKKDPRFIIPVMSAMKRSDLIKLLPEFVAAADNIFLAGLIRMGDRIGRQALLFRDEPDEENPTLLGMTLCEQLVFLHKLDFGGAGLPQKRYLVVINLCLEEAEVYNDRVLMSALDQMSGQFLTGVDKLPIAFMRTCMLVCKKHESLHSWICHVLLPRLVEGSIWNDAKQWEGWMRCAHMLETSGDKSVSSAEAISALPPEQLMQYRSKWAS